MGRIWSVPTSANRGVEVLASWMIDHPAELERLQMKIGASTLDRILLGDVIPDDFEAEAIGLVTGGKVTQAMFAEPGLIPPDVDPDPYADSAAHLDCGACEAAIVASTQKGVLGETPAGPLWAATADDGYVEVHGLGIALRLGASAAAALHRTLGAAIAGGSARA